MRTQHTFDALDRVLEVRQSRNAATIGGVAYTVNASGLRLSITDLVPAAGATMPVARHCSYDALQRLTSERFENSGTLGIDGTIAYTLDRVSNRRTRTSTVAGVDPQSFVYDANDRLTSDQYDANGNTVQSAGTAPGTQFFDNYDFEDRLTRRQSGPAGGNLSTVIEIRYDGDGNKVEEIAGGVTTTYLIDSQNHTGYAQVVEERENGTLTKAYTYALDLLAQHDLDSQQHPITHYFGYDALGSTRVLTDAAGTVSDRFWYDAYGILLKREGTTQTRYLHTGEQEVAALGMYYLRARYFGSPLGRFQSRDHFAGMIDSPMSLNLYAYALSSPTSRIDPGGNVSIDLLVATGLRKYLNRSVAQKAYTAYRKLRSALCIFQMTGVPQVHHLVPMFMVGRESGATVVWDAAVHRQFHQLLHYMLRFRGYPGGNASRAEWRALFASNPASRAGAHEVLLKACRMMDAACRLTKGYIPVTPIVQAQIRLGLWDF